MPVSLDLSADYTLFDGLETVVFRSDRKALEDYFVEVESCLRRQISTREQAASGGVYQAGDVRWHIPKTLLLDAAANGLEPKPGDYLQESIDEDEESFRNWTILAVEKATLDTRWGLVCRDLRIAFDLRELVEVWSPDNAQDQAVSRVPVFSPRITGLAARIQEVSADVVDERGKRGLRHRYEVFVERRITVSNEDQLRDASGNVYEVRGYRQPDRIDELQLIEVERVP